LLVQVERYLPTVSNVQHIACSGTQGLAHCQHCAAPCLLRYTGTCPLLPLCSTLLAQVHRYFPTVSTVQHIACSGTKVLAFCQQCAAPGLLRYTGTCPLLPLCSTLLAQVHSNYPTVSIVQHIACSGTRYLPTVSNVQHLACSGTQVLAHCYHCAAPCLLRYTGTCPLSAFCSILLVQVQRYLPTVRNVQHLDCS
jgi:hypothetical protein